jgi:hypothetical protein
MRPLALPWLSCTFLALLLIIAGSLARAGGAEPRSYETGYSNLTKISSDLYQALDKSRRQQLRPQLVFLDQTACPLVASIPSTEGSSPVYCIQVSAGLVALLNYVAHAKALDDVQKGFFEAYTKSILQEDRDGTLLPVGRTTDDKKAWDFDTMNRQASIFNQMTGALLAIESAHHYLGHYKKHAAQFPGAAGQPVPINTLLSEKEWHAAVLKGVRHSLSCGLGTEGLRMLFIAFDQMPHRPAWTAYVLHPKADVSKVSGELERLEKDFFLVEK